MKTATLLLSALGLLLWMGRNWRTTKMSEGWLAETEAKRRREALEWTGVGYTGRFKR
jgi:hypothetical protein